MRKPISTRLHGILDYTTGSLLLAAPTLLGLDRKSRAAIALQAAGAGHIGYSLVTDYELSLRRALPMPAHLAVDAAGAVALAAAPWLLGTKGKSARSWVPHVALGAYELLAVALSETAAPSAGETAPDKPEAKNEPEAATAAPGTQTAPGPDVPAQPKTPDKPAGTELHPPNVNPSRQGPAAAGKKPRAPKEPAPATGEPRPEAGPGEPGLTAPKK